MLELLMHDAISRHNAGRLDEAAALYRQVLDADPKNYPALYSLGAIHSQLRQYEEAERLFAAAAKVMPDQADAHFSRGVMLLYLRRFSDALACFDTTATLAPEHIEAHTNRAAALMELERFGEAQAACETALAFDSDFARARIIRANALFALGRREEALEDYDKAAASDPSLPSIAENREAALFQMGRMARAPVSYMRRLFDSFSLDYDAMMVDKLTYRGHEHLRALADKYLAASSPRRLLDLGCGTGLVGAAFADRLAEARIDGIDIAPRMIEAARRRALYDVLFRDDLENFLAAPGIPYDLVLSADTMIYLGDLAPTFAGVASRLKPGGYFLFTVERGEEESWDFSPTLRFRHSESYLREEAKRAGLACAEFMECALRTEEYESIPGYAVALQKPN